MRSNFVLKGILFLLIGFSPASVISEETPLRVVMLFDQQKYNDTIGLAFSIAFVRAQKELNYTLESHVLDTMGSATMVTRAHFVAEKNWKPHLYIGEQESLLCRTIATLAASKNRMYVSLGGSVEQFALNLNEFPTFASSGRVTYSMAAVVTKVMKKFDWTRAVVISALAEINVLQARFVKEAIVAAGLQYIPYNHAESNLTQEDFNPRKNSVNIMFKHLTKERACFFVLLMPNKEAQFVLKYAAEIGLMNGDYAFLVQGLVENLGTEIEDYDGFDGVLSIDRPLFTDSKTWQDFEDQMQSAEVEKSRIPDETQDYSFITSSVTQTSNSSTSNVAGSSNVTGTSNVTRTPNGTTSNVTPAASRTARQIQSAVRQRSLKYAGLMYDAVMMWVHVLRGLSPGVQGLNERPDLDAIARDGKNLAAQFGTMRMYGGTQSWSGCPLSTDCFLGVKSETSRDQSYGVTGLIATRNRMRLANYTLNIIQGQKHKEILRYSEDSGNYEDLNPQGLVWPGGGMNPPKEEKDCVGFWCGKEHIRKLLYIIGGSIGGIIIVAFLTVALAWLLLRYQERNAIAKWRINWSEVQVSEDNNTSQSNSIQVTTDRESNRPSAVSRTPKPDGIYRGTSISVKKINRESVDIFESSIYAELKQILYVRHDNINPFVGVCVDAPNVCVAMVHAEKGSLQDVLADPQFEWQFHMSLAIDIAMGMEYLHSTPVETHGHLTSANCVIDERWVCKITDYGLKLFRGIDKLQRRLSDLLWTAPEILHKKEGDPDRVHGTKPGDVYSFGIIVSELLTGQLPYHESLQHGNVKELLAKVKLALEPPFRPTLPSMEEHVSYEWIDLAKHCWQTTALKRPTFKAIRAKLTDTYSGKFTNVFERTQMILEESLERASEELMVEKRKTENMLRNFVPSSLLQAIGRGQQVEPQLVKAVTLCQCDTTGLYKATSQLSAELVVDVLKSLYQKYDEIIANYGAHEVSTWGSKDSMMLAGGLPLNSATNTQGICAMSVDLLNVIARFSQPIVKANTLKIKISIHAGPVYTSVIGTEIPQFCVYGEAVQATTNLHAFAKEMAIRISKPARNLLPRNSVIKVVEAGEVKFKKGKPLMTYFITGRRQSSVTRRKSPVGRKSSSPKGAKLRPSVASKKSKSSTTNN